MGRGYWLPPGHEKLKYFDGFYVDCAAVYTDSDIETGWQLFLDNVCNKLAHKNPNYKRICEWVPCNLGQSRFVLMENDYIEIIAEEADGYIAVYAIVPETKKNITSTNRHFQTAVKELKDILLELYPGNISRRLNSQHIEIVG